MRVDGETRKNYMGMGLVGRTLGLVGMGNIGKEAFKLAKTLRDAPTSPPIRTSTPAEAEEVGVETRRFGYFDANC